MSSGSFRWQASSFKLPVHLHSFSLSVSKTAIKKKKKRNTIQAIPSSNPKYFGNRGTGDIKQTLQARDKLLTLGLSEYLRPSGSHHWSMNP